MTLATSAAPLNSERRDTSAAGTRAVVSSQQLMRASKHCRAPPRRARIHRVPNQLQLSIGAAGSSDDRGRSGNPIICAWAPRPFGQGPIHLGGFDADPGFDAARRSKRMDARVNGLPVPRMTGYLGLLTQRLWACAQTSGEDSLGHRVMSRTRVCLRLRPTDVSTR